ncbi:MAG: hypothetical protein Devi2KO_40800 [Devosia indica]
MLFWIHPHIVRKKQYDKGIVWLHRLQLCLMNGKKGKKKGEKE